MSRHQRDALDALLRSAPRAETPPTPEEQREGFAAALTRPAPDGVVSRRTVLGGRPALELDPDTASGPGRLLYLHGGGYLAGSPDTHAGLAGELARRAGLRAVSVDYRLAPEHPFPAAVDDGLAAYRELLSTGTDPQDLVLAGDSAGGGLGIATLLAAREAGLPQPAAVALFSPWVDLTLTGGSIRSKEGADPIFTEADVRAYADLYVGAGDRAAPWPARSSPTSPGCPRCSCRPARTRCCSTTRSGWPAVRAPTTSRSRSKSAPVSPTSTSSTTAASRRRTPHSTAPPASSPPTSARGTRTPTVSHRSAEGPVGPVPDAGSGAPAYRRSHVTAPGPAPVPRQRS